MSTPHSQYRLLSERRFLPFFLTQFLGAFNDNVYKNALVIMLAFQAAQLTTISPGTLINICAGLFILPFFLFSATAGQLADKYEKSRIMRLVKLFEIGIMVVGAAGFLTQNLMLLMIALFLMGMHSTVFGPVKYAILPQHLKPEELIGGNGLVETGTFVAVLLGTVLGGVLIGLPSAGAMWVAMATLTIAVLGYLASRGVPDSPAPAPDLRINWNPLTETWRNFHFMRGNRTVFLSVLGISWFWFFGAIFITQFPDLSRHILLGNEHVVTLLLIMFSIGIGAGSLLCERLSGHKVEIGLVPFGSIGLTLFAVDLYFALTGHIVHGPVGFGDFLRDSGHWRILADLLLIHSVYRLEKNGLEHIPEEGPAVLVCNHVSFVDALIIAAACRRPVRFVMDHQIFRIPVLNFVFRTGRAIPIASARESPELLEKAYDEIAGALEQGDLVCIFPEGKITDSGELYPFRPGIKRIIARTPVPVVPLALRGLWGSFFSRKGGKAMTRPFARGMFPRIALAVDQPVPPQLATPEGLQQTVLALRGDWK